MLFLVMRKNSMNEKTSSPQNVLERIIFKTVDIPALPHIVAKSLSLLNNNNVSLSELEATVGMDQAFVSRLLRIANSPFYGMSKAVDTISGAIKLVGFSAVKSLIVSVSFKDLHRKTDTIDEIFWGHSIAVAAASVAIAEAQGIKGSDDLFVAGLIHDIGKTVINHSDSALYKQVLSKVTDEGLTFKEAETEILGFDHSKVGGYIARKWKLPIRLEEIIEYHHTDKGHGSKDSVTQKICEIIDIADKICWELSIGVPISVIKYKPKENKSSIFDLLNNNLSLNMSVDDVELFKKNLIEEFGKHSAVFKT